MPTVTEYKNSKGKITSFKAIVRYKGIFLTKTFPIKANEIKTVKREATMWGLDIERQINEGIYRKEEKKHNFTVAQAIEKYISDTKAVWELVFISSTRCPCCTGREK